MKIFWTTIEYKYLKTPKGYEKYKGGLVDAFVKANDVRDALEKFSEAFKSYDLHILLVEFVAPCEDIPWETEVEQKKHDTLVNKAQETDQVIFDDFYSYGDEE